MEQKNDEKDKNGRSVPLFKYRTLPSMLPHACIANALF